MEPMDASDQVNLKCEHHDHNDAEEFQFCVDCSCVACSQCFKQDARHSGHQSTDLKQGKTLLVAKYEQLCQTVTNVVKKSISAACRKRDRYADKLGSSAKCAKMEDLIRKAIEQLKAMDVKVGNDIQAVVSRKVSQCQQQIEQQLVDSKLRLEADRLSQTIDGIVNGPVSELFGRLSTTTEEYEQFEETYRKLRVQLPDAEVRVNEQTLRDLEAVEYYCRNVACRIKELYKRVDVEKSGGSSETVFVFGCSDDYNQMFAYDSANDKWCSASNTLTARRYAAATWWNNKLIVTGGYSDPNSAEQYDAETNTWSCFPDLVHGRYWHSMANLNGYLFVIGGLRDSMAMEQFDSLKGKWKLGSNTTSYRYGHATATTSHGVIIIGGVNSLFECEKFNLLRMGKTCCEIAPLNEGRCRATAASVRDIVFVFGGCSKKHVLYTVEQYDEMANKWTVISTRTTVSRLDLGSAVVNGRIYIVGRDPQVATFDAETQQFGAVASLSVAVSDGLSAACLVLSNAALDRLRASSV